MESWRFFLVDLPKTMPGAAGAPGPGITNPQMGVGGFPPPVGGESQQQKWKGERIPGWLGYIRDYTIPIYIGILLNHDKDLKKTKQPVFHGK